MHKVVIFIPSWRKSNIISGKPLVKLKPIDNSKDFFLIEKILEN